MDILKNAGDILFLDIETVTGTASYHELSDRLQHLWTKKSGMIDDQKEPDELYFEKGAIFSEFGKVITISVGFFFFQQGELSLKIKSFWGHNEKELLEDFKRLLERFDPRKLRLCAHNGKEFDIPYLCRRMLINAIPIPEALNVSGKKPWEILHYDTLEMWKFGDRKNYTSLETLATVFDIPTSKDQMDGSYVNVSYYKEDGLDAIRTYCEKDVLVTAQVFLKLHCLELVREKNILFCN
jgi:DNA polymerase elongation subunit (family B)